MSHLYQLSLMLLLLTTNVLALDESLKLNGDFTQGGLVRGAVIPGNKVILDGRSVRVSDDGEFIIGFGRDYPRETVLTIISIEGNKSEYVLQIAQREYKIQRINGLPKAQVNPNEEILKRIKLESADIRKARNVDDARTDFDTIFKWPVKGPVTGVYGSQRILNGEPRQPHYGLDVAAPVGTAVFAPASGVVTYAASMYFSGGTLVLDHGHNLSSSFLHLEKILVQVGDKVEQGDKIALVGATGRVTGPHLDWRMNWREQRIDPGLLVGEPIELVK